MADPNRLQEFQRYLAERLHSASAGEDARGWLGLEVGGQHWLLDLADGGEIVASPAITPVPMTRPWFLGLTNVRGNLFAVTDFAAFCGGAPTPLEGGSLLVLVGSRHGANAALLVGRILGLRRPADFSAPEIDPERPAWGAALHADKHGTIWQRLGVRELLADPHFMNIGA